jgi:hypothetical protein
MHKQQDWQCLPLLLLRQLQQQLQGHPEWHASMAAA